MDIFILFEKPDGSVRVRTCSTKDRKPGETDEQLAARKAAQNNPNSWPWRLVRASALPATRRFRDHWRIQATGVSVDVSRARQQVMVEVRRTRDRLLDESDKHKNRVDDVGTSAQKKAVTDYRQSLRDLPAVVEPEISGLTVDQLERYEPQFPAPTAFAKVPQKKTRPPKKKE